MKRMLKVLGITYFVSPSNLLVIHLRQESGTKVYTKKLYTSKLGRILLKIMN